MESNGKRERWRSYSSFGLFREGQASREELPRSKCGRFKLIICTITLVFFVTTAVFFTLHVNRSTKTTAPKAKRFVSIEETKPKKDVAIVPEENAHPNHRYGPRPNDARMIERMVKDVYWSPEERNNIRDIIHRAEWKEMVRKKKPVLFKGVYLKKRDGEEDLKEQSMDHFREINEMLQGETTELPVDGESHRRKLPPHRGVPFQPAHMGSDEEPRVRVKKPIKLMLDIYPMVENESDVAMERPQQESAASTGKNVAYALVPIRGGRPMRGRGRMVLRLNLYPKRHYPRWNRRGMNRRTFGWFKKKRQGHVCRLISHNPVGNPVTAEWKDDNGNWIKANYLTLKHWDRKLA